LAGPRFDLPNPDNETQPFWDGAREGRLVIRRCNACGEASFYPRPFCPKCWSEDVSWIDASGRATLYTWSVVHVNDLPPFPERVPYVAAIVTLEEGPRMMTNVVGVGFDDLDAEMALQVTFTSISDEPPVTIPVFERASA
jgi:uncharacterized OB-fold protein